MFKSLRKVLIATVAFTAVLAGCNSNVADETAASAVPCSSVAISTNGTTTTYRLTSDLNPGYGSAVYFTGSFNEGNNWTTAVRGTYTNGWYVEVTADAGFEWKALTGSYDIGETVTDFSSLTWESGDNHKVVAGSADPSANSNIRVITIGGSNRYGQCAYFTGTFNEGNNWNTAIHASYNYTDYKYYAFVTTDTGSIEWKALRAFGSFGDTVAAPFNGLNWDSGANNTECYTICDYLATLTVPYASAYVSSNGDFCASCSTFNADVQKYISGVKVEVYLGSTKLAEETLTSSSQSFRSTVEELGVADNELLPLYATFTPVTIYGTYGKVTKAGYNTVGMNSVSYGSFTMGSDTDSYTDNAAHNVKISKSFYMSKYEVTQKQFEDVMGYNPANIPDKCYYIGDNYPVVYCSWVAAIAYCNKLSLLSGLTPVYTVEGIDFETLTFDDIRKTRDFSAWENVTVNTSANGYRLPTEAEWEYVATAAGTVTDLANNIKTLSSGEPTVNEIGSTNASAWGFYDLSGNVGEWVFDSYGAFTSDDAEDPTGAEQSAVKVSRGGGAWAQSNVNLLYRYSCVLSSGGPDQGFRVVRNYY